MSFYKSPHIIILLFSLLINAPSQVCLAQEENAPSGKLPVEVVTRISADSVLIGEKANFSISVRAPKEAEIQFFDFPEDVNGLNIKDTASVTKNYFWKKEVIRRVTYDSLTPGKYEIPQVTIRFRMSASGLWQETQSEVKPVVVKSLLSGNEKAGELRDIKGPVRPRSLWSIILLVIVFVLAAGFWLSRLFKKTKLSPRATSPIPAHILAFQRLEELQNRGFVRRGLIKEFYFQLSLIVRYYLEDRFQLRAPEMTTEEFLSYLRGCQDLSSEHKSLLGNFLSHCDMVKFAKYAPQASEIEESFESAKKLIEQTKALDVEIPDTK